MSTTWFVPITKNARNAELAIRKMTGWKKADKEPTINPTTQILTDGEYYVHCDRKPISIVDHGQFAVLKRFNQNYLMEETLKQIDGAFSEHDDPTVVNCDNCGEYMMNDKMYITHNESLVCYDCNGKSETMKKAAKTMGIKFKDIKK